MIAQNIVSIDNTIRSDTAMTVIIKNDAFLTADVLALVTRERESALSYREWKHRLAGYGYGVRDTDHGSVLETLPHHVEVCVLPADLCA